MERNEKLKKLEIVKVVKTLLIRGIGTTEDPVREVVQYWDLKGNLIYDSDKKELASSDIRS